MRRQFLTITIVLVTVLIGCNETSSSKYSITAGNDSTAIPARIKMVSDKEPGEAMIISGTIYLPGGKTSANSAILSVWHTDSKGYYIEGGGGAGEEHPRLHGRMKTLADGKYEFRTIKPAPYPDNTAPAHVHGHISAPGFPEYAFIYYFEGDKLITNQNRSELNSHRGGTPSIIQLVKDTNGTLIGHRDLILEYVKPSAETMKLKW